MNEHLKHMRINKGMTQTELAQRANLSRRTINYIENGKIKNPTKATMLSIAKALDVSVQSIFFY